MENSDTGRRRTAPDPARSSERARHDSVAGLYATLDVASVGLAQLGPDGRFLRVNKCLGELLGYAGEELLARTIHDVITPVDQAEIEALTSRVVTGGVSRDHREALLLRRDGTTLSVDLSLSAVRDASDAVVFLVASVEDLSEAKASDEARVEVEALLNSALEASDTGTFRWNVRTNRIEWDASLVRLFGIGPEEAEHSVDEFYARIHRSDRPRVEAAIARSIEKGVDFSEEFRVVWPDGSVHWLWQKARTLTDFHGTPIRMTGACTDITERKRAEEKLAAQKRHLEESEARLRALLEASPLGIDIMDLEGNPTFFNPRAEELHGIRLDPTNRLGWSEAVHPEDRERVANSWYEAARAGESWAATYRFVHPDGRVVWVSGRAAPMRIEGKMVGFVGTLEDITALKETEQALRESEEQFRTLGNSIPQLVWMADPDGRIFWFNDRWYEYIGATPEEMERLDWREVLHPEHMDRIVEGMGRVFGTSEPWEDTFPIRGRNGEYRWFLSRMLPIRDEDGNVVRWFGTNTDVTDAIEAVAERERLLEREREARGAAERRAREEEALREAARAVAASFTTEEVIQQVARSAVAATNADGAFVERIEIHGREIVIVAAAGESAAATGTRVPYSGSLAEHVVQHRKPLIVRRLAEARHQLPGHLVRLRPDDSALVVPLGNGGEPIGALILLRGVDKLRFRRDEIRRAQTFADLAALAFRKIRMLEESEQRREELQSVMESRARLMRGFSHDVKNPLGSADGLLALLEDGIVGEIANDQKDYVARARRAIANSLGLIEDLLEFARAESGQIEIKDQRVDLRDAVCELAEEYRAHAEAKGLETEIELPDEFPIIETDPDRVRQIVGNLLSNAVKFTPKGRVRVSLRLHRDDDPSHIGEWVVAEVADTGPGIPPEKHRLLFQEFSRLHPGETKGAGVGLAISQRIAHALGGEITVSSDVGRGSVFALWLPRKREA